MRSPSEPATQQPGINHEPLMRTHAGALNTNRVAVAEETDAEGACANRYLTHGRHRSILTAARRPFLPHIRREQWSLTCTTRGFLVASVGLRAKGTCNSMKMEISE